MNIICSLFGHKINDKYVWLLPDKIKLGSPFDTRIGTEKEAIERKLRYTRFCQRCLKTMDKENEGHDK